MDSKNTKLENGLIVTDFTDDERTEACYALEQVSSGDIRFSFNEGESMHYVDIDSILAELGVSITGGDWYAAAYEVILRERRRGEAAATDENPFKNEFPEWMGLGSDGADCQEDIPEQTRFTVTLSQTAATPVVTLKPGPTGNTLSAMPGDDLTPEAKVLFDEIVSNFEDWLHNNDLEPWEVVRAAAAAQSYIAGRMMDVIAIA